MTYSDPTDDVVITERKTRLKKSINNLNIYIFVFFSFENSEVFDGSQFEFYCSNCDSHVANKSKHCKRCDRCVSNFDHHCKWVNNCIGGKNYKIFLGLIISVFFSCGTFCAIVGFFIKLYFSKNEKGQENITKILTSQITFNIFFVLVWIFGIITVVFVILDLNLIFFHIWLMRKKITTYEYILGKREEIPKNVCLYCKNILEIIV